MPTQKYVRGNGARALGSKVSLFNMIAKITLFSVLAVLYVILQSQVKLVSRETVKLEQQKFIMAEELERLIFANDKMIPYGTLSEFAVSNLKMKHSPANIKSFAVTDRKGLIRENSLFELPKLFDTEINLALIAKEDRFMER